MKELIDPEDQLQQASSGLATFPSLQYLEIGDVPSLVCLSICPLDFHVLSTLDLTGCPKLKKLPFKSDIINNKFKDVAIDEQLWKGLEWEDTIIQSHLSSFMMAHVNSLS